MLLDRYHETIDELLKTVRTTQRDAIIAAGHFTGLAPEQTRAYVAAVRAALAADPTRAAALATPDDTKVLV